MYNVHAHAPCTAILYIFSVKGLKLKKSNLKLYKNTHNFEGSIKNVVKVIGNAKITNGFQVIIIQFKRP
jgi:hypothetical protein